MHPLSHARSLSSFFSLCALVAGLTNTLTAVKNAQLAQSPLLVFAGATAMILKGRGSLQDIDQLALMQSAVKASWTIASVRDIIPTIRRAFRVAQEGVPGQTTDKQ